MEYMAAQMDRQIEGAISENERLSNEAEYYRAGVEQRAPRVVPSRVRLPKRVCGDFPIGHGTIAEAGDHDCESNRWGALSVRASNGQMLGIKPAEFDPIAWRNLDKTRHDSAHYSVMALAEPNTGMAALRAMFPEAKADDLNMVLFSTSGVHGTYCTIEEVEEDMARPAPAGPRDVTFVIVHPRLVAMRYGVCKPETDEDIEFLKRLRATSHAALSRVGICGAAPLVPTRKDR